MMTHLYIGAAVGGIHALSSVTANADFLQNIHIYGLTACVGVIASVIYKKAILKV